MALRGLTSQIFLCSEVKHLSSCLIQSTEKRLVAVSETRKSNLINIEKYFWKNNHSGASPVISMFLQRYSLMVEQWSSKSHARVRFLLSLIKFFIRPYRSRHRTPIASVIRSIKKYKKFDRKFAFIFPESTQITFFNKSHSALLPNLLISPNVSNISSFFVLFYKSFFTFFRSIYLFFYKTSSSLYSIFFFFIKYNNFIRQEKKSLMFFVNNPFTFLSFNNSCIKSFVGYFRAKLRTSKKTFLLASNNKPVFRFIPHKSFSKKSLINFHDIKNINYLKILNRTFSRRKLNLVNFSVYSFDSYVFAEDDEIQIGRLTPTWDLTTLNLENLNYPLTFFSGVKASFFPLNHEFLEDDYFFESNLIQNFQKKILKRRWRKKKSKVILEPQFSLPLKIKAPFHKFFNVSSSYASERKSNLFYNLYNLSSFNKINSLFFNPFLFKLFFFSFSSFTSYRNVFSFLVTKTTENFNNFYFYDRQQKFSTTNLYPNKTFFHVIEKRLLRTITKIRYKSTATPWYFHMLVRFFIFCTGRRVFVKLSPFVSNALSFSEQARCLKWAAKVKKYRKLLGSALFLTESLQIMYLTLKLKDPYLLSDWLTKIFQRISFWKSRVLLSYMKYLLRHFFYPRFPELKMKGIKFQLSGKVSVAGNARTRTLRCKIGYTSQSKIENKILTTLSFIPSFTGVQGFKIWLFF